MRHKEAFHICESFSYHEFVLLVFSAAIKAAHTHFEKPGAQACLQYQSFWPAISAILPRNISHFSV